MHKSFETTSMKKYFPKNLHALKNNTRRKNDDRGISPEIYL